MGLRVPVRLRRQRVGNLVAFLSACTQECFSGPRSPGCCARRGSFGPEEGDAQIAASLRRNLTCAAALEDVAASPSADDPELCKRFPATYRPENISGTSTAGASIPYRDRQEWWL